MLWRERMKPLSLSKQGCKGQGYGAERHPQLPKKEPHIAHRPWAQDTTISTFQEEQVWPRWHHPVPSLQSWPRPQSQPWRWQNITAHCVHGGCQSQPAPEQTSCKELMTSMWAGSVPCAGLMDSRSSIFSWLLVTMLCMLPMKLESSQLSSVG